MTLQQIRGHKRLMFLEHHVLGLLAFRSEQKVILEEQQMVLLVVV